MNDYAKQTQSNPTCSELACPELACGELVEPVEASNLFQTFCWGCHTEKIMFCNRLNGKCQLIKITLKNKILTHLPLNKTMALSTSG